MSKLTDRQLQSLRNIGGESEDAANEIDALRADYGQACKLVADMHAAATGRHGEGPRLGVIEDVASVRAELVALRAQVEALKAASLEGLGLSEYEKQLLHVLREQVEAIDLPEQKP